ncbi:hypothetical protein ABIE13_001314 [Ottowia thiooxydans]|uniref:Transposase DDE domain-containing protein n=1 Tax=Ottowia thiooxydans TaxID=219182 RepID=A0ABV2Q5A6_9BURK
MPDENAQSEGDDKSMQCPTRIEQGFGGAKTIGQVRQVMMRGIKKVAQTFVINISAYNLVRMRSLGKVHRLGAR